MASRGVPYKQLTEEEKTQACFADSSLQYAGITCKWRATAPQPLSRTSLKDSSERKSSQWAKLQAVYLAGHFAYKVKGPDVCLFTIHGLWPMVWLNIQRLGRNGTGKLVTRKSGKEVCEQTSKNGQKGEDIYVPCWKMALTKEGFNTYLNRIICSMDTVSPFYQPLQSSPNGNPYVHQQTVHGGRNEHYTWAQQHGFLLTKADMTTVTAEYPTSQQQK